MTTPRLKTLRENPRCVQQNKFVFTFPAPSSPTLARNPAAGFFATRNSATHPRFYPIFAA